MKTGSRRNSLSKGLRIAVIGLVLGNFIVCLNNLNAFYFSQVSTNDLDTQIAREFAAIASSSIVANSTSLSPPTSSTRPVRWKHYRKLGIEILKVMADQRHARRKHRKRKDFLIEDKRWRSRLQRPRHNTTTTGTHNITIDPADSIYMQRQRSWDASPIVLAEFKLAFFTIPKVGCTVFKQLFRRMEQCPDWRVHSNDSGLPHNPDWNGLTYLYHYNVEDALHIMTSDEWTRAIFVRHPIDRIISAYLDKVVAKSNSEEQNTTYFSKRCCPSDNMCSRIAQNSFQDFLHMAYWCPDPHWKSQSTIMDAKFWPFINFVGHLSTAQADAKALLQRLGAWETYGATGWGADESEPIFASKTAIRHKTNPKDHQNDLCNKDSIALMDALYEDDLQNPLFGFHGNGICSEH